MHGLQNTDTFIGNDLFYQKYIEFSEKQILPQMENQKITDQFFDHFPYVSFL